MKRPAFQFYPDDWLGDANLRRCTHAEKGIWIDTLSLMHQQDPYGILSWPLEDVAQAVGCKLADLRGLTRKGVMSGAESGIVPAFIYIPRSGRKVGDPVTLIQPQEGPIWFSRRMVRDEYVRSVAGASTRFGADPSQGQSAHSREGTARAALRAKVLAKTGGTCAYCRVQLDGDWEIDHVVPVSRGGSGRIENLVPSCISCNQAKSNTMPGDGDAPRRAPSRRQGDRQGDGASSASSSSVVELPLSPVPSEPTITAIGSAKDAKAKLWEAWKSLPNSGGGAFIGKLCREHGEDRVVSAMALTLAKMPADPKAWISKLLRHDSVAAVDDLLAEAV